MQMQVVVFNLGGEQFGLDIQRVMEIIRLSSITRVPGASELVEGVINLRGTVIPVVDLRKRFGIEVVESHENRIVIVEVNGQTVGMIVDGVSVVQRIDDNQIEPVSNIYSVKSEFIVGIAKEDTNMIIILDVDQVVPRTGGSICA